MHGQWTGDFDGTNRGAVTLDLDDLGQGLVRGSAAAIDYGRLPSVRIQIPIIPTKPHQTVICQIQAHDPVSSRPLEPQDIKKLYGDVVVPQQVELTINWDGSTIEIQWQTVVGTKGIAKLSPSKAGELSELVPNPVIQTWEQFRSFAVQQPLGQFLYRGQSEPYRLRTKFHRSRRKDLERFDTEDVRALQNKLVSRTRSFINLGDPQVYAAFLLLVQHHGYPTPLLDWSLSPFVAAFFAFDENTAKKSENVRIFMFDQHRWRRCEQIYQISPLRRNFSVLLPLALENERAVPQQALSTVTNVDDVESYIADMQGTGETPFLQAIDLPFAEREKVRNELFLMGITPASMYPSIDGICTGMRQALFGYADALP